MNGLDKNGIAQRIAQEVKDGYYVNLGIGIPTLVANFVRKDIEVEFQSENGILGMGPFPIEGEEDVKALIKQISAEGEEAEKARENEENPGKAKDDE